MEQNQLRNKQGLTEEEFLAQYKPSDLSQTLGNSGYAVVHHRKQCPKTTFDSVEKTTPICTVGHCPADL